MTDYAFSGAAQQDVLKARPSMGGNNDQVAFEVPRGPCDFVPGSPDTHDGSAHKPGIDFALPRNCLESRLSFFGQFVGRKGERRILPSGQRLYDVEEC